MSDLSVSPSRAVMQSTLMAAASVRLAGCVFDNMVEQNVLLIGKDAKIEPYAERFGAQHPRRLTVASHSEERARRLASRVHGNAIRLDEVSAQLPLHDIVVTCAAGPLPILGKGLLERAIAVRRHRPILIVDLAVPQDVESEVADLDDVFLFRATDLVGLVREHREAIRACCPLRYLSGGLLLRGQAVWW